MSTRGRSRAPAQRHSIATAHTLAQPSPRSISGIITFLAAHSAIIQRRFKSEVQQCSIDGCGQLIMFWKGGNTILIDFLPELVPPAFGEDEGRQAGVDFGPPGGPGHS